MKLENQKAEKSGGIGDWKRRKGERGGKGSGWRPKKVKTLKKTERKKDRVNKQSRGKEGGKKRRKE